jgi:hypothetical protein
MSLHFNFNITNPFIKEHCGKCIFCREPKISKYKAICIQFDAYDWKQLFEIGIDWRDKTQDHWGISIELGLIGFWFHISLYDIRHADTNDDIDYDYETK